MRTIDIHTHLGQSLFGYGQSIEELIGSMGALGIERSVICPVKPHSYHFKEENDLMAKAIELYPDSFIGFCRVDPWQGDKAVDELRRSIEVLNLKGLFLHPWEETCPINSDPVKYLMKTVRELNIPVMFSGGHVRVSRATQISDLASSFPEIQFIATSGGQINISGIALGEAETMLSENSNVFLETSGIYREDFIEDITEKLGSHRVVFGSNSPQYDLRLEVLRPRKLHINEEKKADILYRNAEKLLLG